ncbi:hypothetical protein [Amycolatopsis thermoflava]|uniref:hypothetical protein n=1 Tax=Amycolatopsis thermoflava TaxID=84480 RepID=UPI003F4A6DF0
MSRKDGFPIIASSGGGLKRVVSALVVVAVLAVVIRNPDEAASWAKSLFGIATGAVDGLASFIRGLAK